MLKTFAVLCGSVALGVGAALVLTLSHGGEPLGQKPQMASLVPLNGVPLDTPPVREVFSAFESQPGPLLPQAEASVLPSPMVDQGPQDAPRVLPRPRPSLTASAATASGLPSPIDPAQHRQEAPLQEAPAQEASAGAILPSALAPAAPPLSATPRLTISTHSAAPDLQDPLWQAPTAQPSPLSQPAAPSQPPAQARRAQPAAGQGAIDFNPWNTGVYR